MIRFILKFLGYKIQYECDWGVYSHRYDSADMMGLRPIHKDMSVAPPWAKVKIVRVR